MLDAMGFILIGLIGAAVAICAVAIFLRDFWNGDV